jgi:monoterpene epsilon-lactone hydrolase
VSPPLGLPSERPGHPSPPELAARREGMLKAVAAGNWRAEPRPEETFIAGVRTLRFRARGEPRALLMHLHGGAFRIGCPEAVGAFAAALARHSDLDVFCPAYRLAPEYPYPAALGDAHRVFASLRNVTSLPLILSGDSAGGGLAASLTILSVAEARPLAGLMLLSPWLDLTVTSGSYEANAATDRLFSREAAKQAAEQYLQGMSPGDPLVSPVLGSVAGFPPTFMAIGTAEVLADDSRRFAAALHACGVPSQLLEVPGMEHVAVTRDGGLAGAAATFRGLTEFIARLLGTSRQQDESP